MHTAFTKVVHSAEERCARVKEDGGGFEDGVPAIRRTERASMRRWRVESDLAMFYSGSVCARHIRR